VNYDREMMKEIKRRGLDKAKMTNAQYRAVGLAIRNPVQKLTAATSATASAVRVQTFGITVPLVVLQYREGKCEGNTCGSNVRGEVEACLACSCSGDALNNKRKDPRCACPKGLWGPYIEPD
jgi:hypothetical protein